MFPQSLSVLAALSVGLADAVCSSVSLVPRVLASRELQPQLLDSLL